MYNVLEANDINQNLLYVCHVSHGGNDNHPTLPPIVKAYNRKEDLCQRSV